MAITRSRLAASLRSLGVRPGGVLLVHTRMSALGWVVGASETVVLALLDAVGPEGTLVAYASWEEHAYDERDRPPEHLGAYLAEPPEFVPERAEAVREHGRVPERIRTWPGAAATSHPEGRVVALGARADWICSRQPDDDAYGDDSPFARVVEADGQVLMLGAPLDTVTLIHHAEAIATAPGKRRITFTVGGKSYTDIDTRDGAYPFAEGDDYLEVIARGALDAGAGITGRVGEAECALFDARALTAFAVAWIDARFG